MKASISFLTLKTGCDGHLAGKLSHFNTSNQIYLYSAFKLIM